MTKPLYTIAVHCSTCSHLLYRYQKEGPGKLVKCYVDRIVEDATKGNLTCPSCGRQFARNATVHARPAHKIIGGTIFIRGHVKK